MRKTLCIGPLAAYAIVSTAAAQQGGWLIESNSIVTPSNPTTTIEVWAWFEDPLGALAFAGGDFDFRADDGEFSNPNVLLPWTGGATSPGGTAGTVIGNTVRGVSVAQVFGVLGMYANTENPILVWSVDWTTTDFTSRSVGLNTRNTTNFLVGLTQTGEITQLYPQGFTPGTGVIEVVPSPASAMPMVLVGTVMLRRRR